MADTQILAQQVQATPGDYTPPAGQVITIGAVFAHYDGTGAAGSYVPTLDIISDAGKTILSVVQDSTVAAGTSVEASWAPFLRTAAAAAAGSGITTAFRVTNLSTQTCNNGVQTDLTWNVNMVSAGSPFTTADNKTFVLALGLWQLGFQVTCHALANQASIGPTDLQLIDVGGVDLFSDTLFWSDGDHLSASKLAVVGVQTIDGRGSAIHLKSALANFTGAGILVLSGGELSHLWGNLLIGP
ncbi:MAG: hypothetical protein DMD33_02625 [Gemmatimonadetes bacterium]|nr:MAG: hypothetical protein DMD33_02625 [Gemmatimonadota bacterium]